MADYSRYKYFKVEIGDRIATVTFNQPERLNVLGLGTNWELSDIFLDLGQDSGVAAIILTGAGRAFSAGGDVRAMAQRGQPLAEIGDIGIPPNGRPPVVDRLLAVPQPIIAAVNGDCVGFATTIALFCDIVIASENARIGDTHVKRGLVAGDGGSVIWTLLAGHHRASEYLLTGDLLPAKEAERIGLINRVVPEGQAYVAALEFAKRLAAGAPLAIKWTKLAIKQALKEQVNLSYEMALALEYLSLLSDDQQEGALSFLEKRAPVFHGR